MVLDGSSVGVEKHRGCTAVTTRALLRPVPSGRTATARFCVVQIIFRGAIEVHPGSAHLGRTQLLATGGVGHLGHGLYGKSRCRLFVAEQAPSPHPQAGDKQLDSAYAPGRSVCICEACCPPVSRQSAFVLSVCCFSSRTVDHDTDCRHFQAGECTCASKKNDGCCSGRSARYGAVYQVADILDLLFANRVRIPPDNWQHSLTPVLPLQHMNIFCISRHG